jgi:hypothetical protein
MEEICITSAQSRRAEIRCRRPSLDGEGLVDSTLSASPLPLQVAMIQASIFGPESIHHFETIGHLLSVWCVIVWNSISRQNPLESPVEHTLQVGNLLRRTSSNLKYFLSAENFWNLPVVWKLEVSQSRPIDIVEDFCGRYRNFSFVAIVPKD